MKKPRTINLETWREDVRQRERRERDARLNARRLERLDDERDDAPELLFEEVG